MAEARPPVPPYTLETAALKARKAEDAWNTRNPQQVALAYTVDSYGGTAPSSSAAGRPSRRS